ncbi:unnamed protein product [Coregonus sp. 'balchen']|nr:unnamed protein product [Coregonus sp. 'balchen']
MEGSDLVVKCSTHGRKEDKVTYVYLCINGIAVDKKKTRQEDTLFTMESVTGQQTGIYSCVFSKTLYLLSEVQGKGDNSLSIQVMDAANQGPDTEVVYAKSCKKTGLVKDIFPAKIYGTETSIIEDSDLVVKCSTFGRKDETEGVHVYLCLDGVAVYVDICETYDILFTMKSVTSQQSGNYSCVFSETQYLLSEVQGKGDNSLSIQVIDRILLADISLSGSSTVREGEDVEFQCTIIRAPQKIEMTSHSYLCKNGTAVQMQVFDVNRMEATFTIKSVIKNDTGNYSCVLDLQSKPLENTDRKLYGNNSAFLQVNAVYPAMLFGSKSHVRKGDTIDLKCNISGIKRSWDKVNVYIYKNGVEMRMKVLEKGEDDTIFTMKDVTKEDSGNYSCVYTRDKLLPDQVKSTGKNLVAIYVYEGRNYL